MMVCLCVGVAGLEPTTSASRSLRATRLRHTPNVEMMLQELVA